MMKPPPPPPHAVDMENGYRYASPPPRYDPPPQPKRWFPFLVPLIFVADLALFVYTMYLNDCPSKDPGNKCVLYDVLGRFSFQPLKENPLLGPSITTLEQFGGLERKLVLKGEAWRLISCIWLHAGLVHLIANMFSLLIIGVRLEQEFGFLRIGFLYVLSGLGGSLLSSLVVNSPDRVTISVGASGALFGLLGAMLSELITNWSIYTNKCTALVTLVLIIGLNLAVGLLPNVDNSAHIGGFIAGFFLGFVLLVRPQFGYVSRKHIPPGYDLKHRKPKYKFYQYVFWGLSVAALIAGYYLAARLLFLGATMKMQFINFSTTNIRPPA